jgi:hypothetical protein
MLVKGFDYSIVLADVIDVVGVGVVGVVVECVGRSEIKPLVEFVDRVN